MPLRYNSDYNGLQGVLTTPQGPLPFNCPLIGKVNLYNIMAAVGSTLIKGLSREKIQEGLNTMETLPGRLQPVSAGEKKVVIDYAHTDGALRQLLLSLREITSGKIILVFGAGGGRDKSKRPRMGGVAAELADFLLLTSDNPRQEDPESIINDIFAGFPSGFTRFLIEPDRRRAIFQALDRAEKNDLVVVAGKGHEDYQIFADRTIRFSDIEVIEEWVGEKKSG